MSYPSSRNFSRSSSNLPPAVQSLPYGQGIITPWAIPEAHVLVVHSNGAYSFQPMALPPQQNALSQVQIQQATPQPKLFANASAQTEPTERRHNAVVYFGDDLRLEGSEDAVKDFLNGRRTEKDGESSSDEDVEANETVHIAISREAVTMPPAPAGFDSAIEFQFGNFPNNSVESSPQKLSDNKPDNYDTDFPILSRVPQSNEYLKTKSKKESHYSLSQPVVEKNTTEQVSISPSTESAMQSSIESTSPEPESVQVIKTGPKEVKDQDSVFNGLAGKYTGQLNVDGIPEGVGIWKKDAIKTNKGKSPVEINGQWKNGQPISGHVKHVHQAFDFVDGQYEKPPVEEKTQPAKSQQQQPQKPKGRHQKPVQSSSQQKAASASPLAGLKTETTQPPIAVVKNQNSISPVVQREATKTDVAPVVKAKKDKPVQVEEKPLVAGSAQQAVVPHPVKSVVASALPQRLTRQEIGSPPVNYYRETPPALMDLCHAIHAPDPVLESLRKPPNNMTLRWAPNSEEGSKDPLWHTLNKSGKGTHFFRCVMSHVDPDPKKSFRYIGGWSSRIGVEFPQAGVNSAPEGPGVLLRGDGAIFFGRFNASLVSISGQRQIVPTLEQGKILTSEGYLIKVAKPVRYDTLKMPMRAALGGDQFPESFEIYEPISPDAYANFLQSHCEVAKHQFDKKKKFIESVVILEAHWQLCYEGGVTRTSDGKLAAHSQNADLIIGNYLFRGQLYDGFVFEQSSKIYRMDAKEKKTLIYEGELHSELHEPKPSAANLGRSKLGYFYTETENYYGVFSVNDAGRTLFSGTSGPLPAKGQPAIASAGHRQLDIASIEPSFAAIPPIVFKIDI